ncbi:MAG: hypothetical protein LBG15_05740 [Dysgonamonadaceae bacterium]|jgi:hypothetical protein|nr:hypothetical protein [Dysgonamonadaceae bacterium]
MKGTSHSNVWKSGFLIILFLFPSFAKPLHLSYEEILYSESNQSSSHQHSGDCPVCLFHYQSFTEVEAFELNPASAPLSLEPSFYNEKEYIPFLYLYFLRGPPFFRTKS